MMRAMLRKAWADVRSRPWQTVLVTLMIAAATATVTLAILSQTAVRAAFDRSFDANNGAHVWFWTDREPEYLARIGDLPGVTATVGPRRIIGANYQGFTAVQGGDRYLLRMWVGDGVRPTVSRPALTHGRWLAPDRAGEIVVDRVFARTRGIAVGDQLEIVTPGGPQMLDVVGLAISADRPLYRVWSPGRVFVTTATRETLAPAAALPAQWALGVQLADRMQAQAFIARAHDAYGANAAPPSMAWTEVRDAVDEESILVVLFISVFGVFAVIASGLVIVNTVGNSMLAQLRDIGLLKALGFTPWNIRLLFVLEQSGLALLGTLLGVAAGVIGARLYTANAIPNLSIEPAVDVDVRLLAATALIVIGLIALLTLLAAWRGGNVSTIEAIRAAQGGGARSRLARLAVTLRLPPVVFLGVKDTFNRPLRAWLTVGALTLAVVTATFTLSTESVIQGSIERPWTIGMDPFELLVNRGFVPDAEARRIMDARPEIASFITRRLATVRGAESRIDHEIDVLGGPYQNLPYNIIAGRMLDGPGEVVLSRDAAGLLGLGVGDTLRLALNGGTVPLAVVGEYATFIAPMMVDARSLPDLTGHVPSPDYYGVTVRPGTDLEGLQAALLRDSNDRFDVDLTKATLEESVPQMRIMLIGLTSILLAIAAGNVLTTIRFASRERRHDLAILKAVGMRPRQIVATILVSGSLSAVLALAIGIPLGVALTQALFAYLFESMSIGRGVSTAPNALYLLALVPIVLVISALATSWPARSAARLNVTEALRYE